MLYDLRFINLETGKRTPVRKIRSLKEAREYVKTFLQEMSVMKKFAYHRGFPMSRLRRKHFTAGLAVIVAERDNYVMLLSIDDGDYTGYMEKPDGKK